MALMILMLQIKAECTATTVNKLIFIATLTTFIEFVRNLMNYMKLKRSYESNFKHIAVSNASLETLHIEAK